MAIGSPPGKATLVSQILSQSDIFYFLYSSVSRTLCVHVISRRQRVVPFQNGKPGLMPIFQYKGTIPGNGSSPNKGTIPGNGSSPNKQEEKHTVRLAHVPSPQIQQHVKCRSGICNV